MDLHSIAVGMMWCTISFLQIKCSLKSRHDAGDSLLLTCMTLNFFTRVNVLSTIIQKGDLCTENHGFSKIIACKFATHGPDGAKGLSSLKRRVTIKGIASGCRVTFKAGTWRSSWTGRCPVALREYDFLTDSFMFHELVCYNDVESPSKLWAKKHLISCDLDVFFCARKSRRRARHRLGLHLDQSCRMPIDGHQISCATDPLGLEDFPSKIRKFEMNDHLMSRFFVCWKKYLRKKSWSNSTCKQLTIFSTSSPCRRSLAFFIPDAAVTM